MPTKRNYRRVNVKDVSLESLLELVELERTAGHCAVTFGLDQSWDPWRCLFACAEGSDVADGAQCLSHFFSFDE